MCKNLVFGATMLMVLDTRTCAWISVHSPKSEVFMVILMDFFAMCVAEKVQHKINCTLI